MLYVCILYSIKYMYIILYKAYVYSYIRKFCIYLQDIRQIPIIANRPMITVISGIMYVWCASLKSSVTKIQLFISFIYA